MTVTWLITGSSRGIGLGIVKHLSLDVNNVIFATCRNPAGASDLSSIANAETTKATIHIVKLIADDAESVTAAANQVKAMIGKARLDYLVNNAASHTRILNGNTLASQITPEVFHKDINANVLGPVLVSQAFLDLLERPATTVDSRPPVVVNVTSGLGSFGMKFGSIAALYSMTKAALNMLTYKQSEEKKNIIWICMNPGWVQTDMGGPNAILTIEQSVSKMIEVMISATAQDSGHFKNYNGEELPW